MIRERAKRAFAGAVRFIKNRRLRRAIVWLAIAAVTGLILYAATQARLISPQPTFLLLDRHARFLAETGEHNNNGSGYWLLPAVPPRVAAATIALEDRRFWSHPGVDPVAVGRAVWQNMTSRRRVSGASTLAMQIARMQNPGNRTYWRKASEALTALFLTARYDREEVLRHYLRIVPYGNRIHGISYAARRYFDKPVEDLSWAEISFLAALPQAPGRMNPLTPAGMQSAIQRGRRALDSLYAQSVMSREEYHLAAHQLAGLQMPEFTRRPEIAMHAVLRMEKLFQQESNESPSNKYLFETSLDLDLQRSVTWMAQDAVRTWEKDGAGNAAVIVLNRSTGEVLAYVGSTDYFDTRHAGAINYAMIPRSSGSTLKPFIYALALERGTITPATILDDLHRLNGITNADDEFLGPLLPRVALANSRNVPAVELLRRTGLDETYQLFRTVGLHAGNEPARRYGSGLAIGGLEITLEHLVHAYSVLANDGLLTDLTWRHDQTPLQKRIFSEDTARQVTLFLSDPMARLPGFPRMGATEFPFPVAVKTGTSYAHRDAWAVAYSTRYLVGVWVGHPDYLPMNRLSGYRSAASLAQRVMLSLHPDQKDGLEDVSFPPPRGFTPLRICGLTGKIAQKECNQVFLEWFRPGAEPVELCDAHFAMTLDARSGLPASAETPVEFQEVRSFLKLDSRYASWAQQARLNVVPAVFRMPDAGCAVRDARCGMQDSAPAKRSIHVALPENGTRLVQDPETPTGMATIALQAVVNPPSAQVTWYVDGAPFQVVDYPYTTRWLLQPGDHTFQAKVPYTNTASGLVHIHVE
jgi:penicillin-binding protein 1C